MQFYTQWPTAARKPRGLACICPWEGFGDFYREATRHGGIASTVRESLVDTFLRLTADKSSYGLAGSPDRLCLFNTAAGTEPKATSVPQRQKAN